MLNLLPEETRQRRAVRSSLYSLASTYVAVIAVLVLGALALKTWTYVQQIEINSLRGQVEELGGRKSSSDEIIAKAAFVEDRLRSAKQFEETHQWEEALNAIATATPTDTVLIDVTLGLIETDSKIAVTLGGVTTDRRSIVLFRDKLAQSPNFSQSAIRSIAESSEGEEKRFAFSLETTYAVLPGGNR
jgi:Tfp pilus assembly protein PilN